VLLLGTLILALLPLGAVAADPAAPDVPPSGASQSPAFALDEEAQRGQARLCGTWQWTVHNHKNHQEHKSALILPPPENTPNAPRLSRFVVNGDTVYLRWEFAGAVQEDSLLLTGEGNRLEGTFKNSTGTWGSITGKRIAGCPRPEPR
jgi:hypothetical protein